ncbi:hypothetical protein TNCV_3073461 [Trichonephila clavipes]|nr:hypothetical protein TNCV_3073461 [Trichonephila clavipes]
MTFTSRVTCLEQTPNVLRPFRPGTPSRHDEAINRRLRRLVEMFRTDSSQTPPKRKRDLFEGHKRPENKLLYQFLDLIYSPDDFNIHIYQSDTKNSPSLRKKKLQPKTTL